MSGQTNHNRVRSINTHHTGCQVRPNTIVSGQTNHTPLTESVRSDNTHHTWCQVRPNTIVSGQTNHTPLTESVRSDNTHHTWCQVRPNTIISGQTNHTPLTESVRSDNTPHTGCQVRPNTIEPHTTRRECQVKLTTIYRECHVSNFFFALSQPGRLYQGVRSEGVSGQIIHTERRE